MGFWGWRVVLGLGESYLGVCGIVWGLWGLLRSGFGVLARDEIAGRDLRRGGFRVVVLGFGRGWEKTKRTRNGRTARKKEANGTERDGTTRHETTNGHEHNGTGRTGTTAQQLVSRGLSLCMRI